MSNPNKNTIKKALLIIFSLFIITHICIAQTSTYDHADTINAKAKKLKHLYVLATNSTSPEIYEQQFFDEFPTTFKQLNDIYGYETNKPAPLYDDGPKHIYDLFNNLKNINDTLYYKKIINLAIGAHWDADAVSYFQTGLEKRIEDNIQLAFYILKSKKEKDIISVWAFYFDYESSFARKENYNKLLKLIPSGNKKMLALITAGYQQSTIDWKNNH